MDVILQGTSKISYQIKKLAIFDIYFINIKTKNS